MSKNRFKSASGTCSCCKQKIDEDKATNFRPWPGLSFWIAECNLFDKAEDGNCHNTLVTHPVKVAV